MKAQTHGIVLTHFDHNRLQGLVRLFRGRACVSPSNLEALELGLMRAKTVPAHSIPCDVITMNSRVVLRDLTTGERISLTLVFPDAMTHDPQRVPVLSPLGLALLGGRVGDTIDYLQPHPLLIDAIEFQPEAKGNYYM